MPTRKIEKHDWQSYFDHISRDLPAASVDVEVDGLELGAQVEASHMPLMGLTYDPHDDAFSVSSQDLEHRISRPREIWVIEDAGGLSSIEVVDADGNTQIARLTRAVPLPAGHSARA